jgi:hypothetical protein
LACLPLSWPPVSYLSVVSLPPPSSSSPSKQPAWRRRRCVYRSDRNREEQGLPCSMWRVCVCVCVWERECVLLCHIPPNAHNTVKRLYTSSANPPIRVVVSPRLYVEHSTLNITFNHCSVVSSLQDPRMQSY